MLLTKKFIFKTSTNEAIILGHLTYSASKLFNEANYQRHEYEKLGLEKRPNWYDQKKNMKTNMWYKNLPSQTAQDVLKTLDESWKSYDVLKYKYDHGKKLSGEPKAPYYKKKDSHTNITYLNNGFKIIENKIRFAISKAMKEHLYNKFKIDSHYFYVPIKEQIDGEIKEITFSFINKFEYEVFISYETFAKSIKPDNGRHISIDLGINNLMTVYDNIGRSFIISG
ncbi:MAG: transposase, partial [Bacilli bacterium]|nr:transposase [Bacilli bacterium]